MKTLKELLKEKKIIILEEKKLKKLNGGGPGALTGMKVPSN